MTQEQEMIETMNAARMERELGHGAVHTSLDPIRKLETEPTSSGTATCSAWRSRR
jgi:hypothetical protein